MNVVKGFLFNDVGQCFYDASTIMCEIWKISILKFPSIPCIHKLSTFNSYYSDKGRSSNVKLISPKMN